MLRFFCGAIHQPSSSQGSENRLNYLIIAVCTPLLAYWLVQVWRLPRPEPSKTTDKSAGAKR